MSKNCEKYAVLIEDLVKGELGSRSAAQTQSHISGCSDCQNEYELLRREKEIFARYLFDFEPPPDSRINFQVRLTEEIEPTRGDTPVPAANPPNRRKRLFVFDFSPAFAALSILLLFFGTGFIILKNAPFEKDGDNYVTGKKQENLQRVPRSSKIEQETETNLNAKNAAGANDHVPKNSDSLIEKQSLKAKNISLFEKKRFPAETVKFKQKTIPSNSEKKPAGFTQFNNEARTAAVTQRRNLETEIAGQVERVELLLRSFRNAREIENVETFDVDYERKQARKLLETNERLRRDAETYGIPYGEELLSRVEPLLLEIANLGSNPAPERVLDIKERVSRQNIIASLQVY